MISKWVAKHNEWARRKCVHYGDLCEMITAAPGDRPVLQKVDRRLWVARAKEALDGDWICPHGGLRGAAGEIPDTELILRVASRQR